MIARIVKHFVLFVALSTIGAAAAIAVGSDRTGMADWYKPGPDKVLGEIKGATGPANYTVQLQAPPLASYRGGVPGLPATNPAARGETTLDADSPASRAYLNHLEQLQSQFLGTVTQALGRPVQTLAQYRYAFNGLALQLTPNEAEQVAKLPGVLRVQREFKRFIETDAGPEWIGAPSVWDGTATGSAGATLGEGVIIGVIDTGVNFDHPSFADPGPVDGHEYTNPLADGDPLTPDYLGLCDPLTGLPFCNNKLIGVYDCTDGACLAGSPEDDNGHGSHTASTAGGNFADAVLDAPTITIERRISGVAPHANLVTYKACVAIGSCLSTSLVAAIDQATADGVDVINYSIGGGSSDPWSDADAQAFLGARDAGILVATSAGNSGPKSETIGSPADAPWVMSVGASTHNRKLINSLVDMTGGQTTPPGDIEGKSITAGYGPAPIVHAADFGDGQCLNPFPPGTWDDEIVICDRGTIPRVSKCDNVAAGGANGCVLANTGAEGESTVADPHSIPAVHIGFSDAQVLEAWVRDGGSGHTATIAGTVADLNPANGDIMAGFSSRGANPAVPGVIKPDVTAPGVDILAAFNTPTEYNVISGTSMSSPHGAGAAALIRALHPDLTPAEVQSVLMTSALNTTMLKEDGATPADPFDMGAGRIDLTRAGRVGLVLHEEEPNYTNADPDSGGDPTSLNIPSLGNANCEGSCSWTRVLRSVAGGSVTWTASTSAPPDLALTVSPSQFTLAPGGTQSLEVTADVENLPVGRWVFGQVTLASSDGAVPDVHFPVAVLPGGEPKLVEITTDSDTGSHMEQITSPVDVEELSATIFGLIPGQIVERQLEQDPTPLDPYDTALGTFHISLEVPAGARLVQADIVETTSTDLDLFIGLDENGDGPEASEELCASTSPTADESCRLQNPAGGTYWVMVQNWLSGQAIDDVVLQAFVIPGTDEGNMEVTGPGPVPADTPFDVTIAWNEPQMDPGEVWFGLAELASAPGQPPNVGSLLVKINRIEGGGGGNRDPQAKDDSATVERGGSEDIDVLANDSDPDGDTLTVDSFTQPSHGTVTENADGTLKYTHDGSTGHSEDSFTYTVSDGNGGSDTATVNLTITDPPPTIAGGAKFTGGGWLQSVDGGKINFGGQARDPGDGGGLKGDLQLNDKKAGVKIHVSKITALGEVVGDCGSITAASNALEFQGAGSFNGADGAEFRVCVQDNGEPGRGVDKFHLACLSGCDYSTGGRAADDVIDGGNIQVAKGDGDSAAGNNETAESTAESTTMILDPLLLTKGIAGELQVFEVTVFDQNQESLAEAEVTLTRVATDGSTETLLATTDLTGVATFTVVNLDQVAEYLAESGNAESNAIEVSPVLE